MSTYADVGIHLDDARRTTSNLGEILARSRGPAVLADVGAFGGMFWLEAAAKVVDPVLVASADGIGTKVKIASILGRYDALGMDIVNHCVNDIAVQGARPLFFLDYLAFHRADPEVVSVIGERSCLRRAPRSAARCWAARRRKCPTSTLRASSTWPASSSACSGAPRLASTALRKPATCCWACLPTACTPTATVWRGGHYRLRRGRSLIRRWG